MRKALLLGSMVISLGACVADSGFRTDTGAGDGDADADADGDEGGEGEEVPGACESCLPGEVCVEETCVASSGDCATSDDCSDDSWCLEAEAACIPFGTPAGHDTDPDCQRIPEPGPFAPALQCSYSDPPAGDPTPSHVQVMSTPVVVDFRFDPAEDADDPEIRPSIVFNTFAGGSYGDNGVLRIVDGRTCEIVQSLNVDPADRTIPAASPSLGDLDLDGRPEIVSPASGGGLVAFRWDEAIELFVRLWHSRDCDSGANDTTGGGNQWSGASIHDLDDDGVPEIVYGAVVYDADGCVVDDASGFRQYSIGQVPVLADLEGDGEVEWIAGNEVLRFDAATRTLVADAAWAGGGLSNGFVAVADFGEFPGTASEAPGIAEIAVISAGVARIQTMAGEVVFGPFARAGLATGGPPTIADFDGDGMPELASAGGDRYVVFDLECDADPIPDFCEARGIRWSQPSQDHSSSVTGSSVFDFEGDAAAEAVYADECYVRVYDGATGTVKFSQARSSGTTYENPIVVDVDGDYNSEIVSSTNDYAGTLGCDAEDELFPGAAFSTSHGIRVYRDVEDRWVNSRPVWNQHAYAVTGVGDEGAIPRTSEWQLNWMTPGLNNFRQNVQGSLFPNPAPDLTGRGEAFEVLACEEGDVRILLHAEVCNRGTEPVGAGVTVRFLDGDPEAGAVEICAVETAGAIAPGHCEAASCEWAGAPMVEGHDVTVAVDTDGENFECFEANNLATIRDVRCETLM